MEKWRTYKDDEKTVFSETLEEQERELAECEQLCDFKRIREEMKNDPFRPIYHFLRPDGYLNDPNGLCFWEGRWHLFYQAGGPGCIHWGHAVSEDMLQWRDLPYAIYPKVEPYCFSGGTCVDEENHRVIAAYYGYTGYTGFNTDDGYKCGIVIATSSDPLLLNWTKVNGGDAVIPDRDAPCWTAPDAPPVENQKPYQVFDSYIWKEDGVYYLLTAGYTPDPVTGRRFRQMHLLRCEDDDLLHWEFVKHFLDHDRFREAGDDGACPYFMPIGEDSHILFHFSHRGVPKYLLGKYDSDTHDFVPFNGGRFTSGYGVVVAPSAFPCGGGDVCVIFNMSERKPQSGWSGIMTLPRKLSLGGAWGDELIQRPYADLSPLYKAHTTLLNVSVADGEMVIPEGIEGNAFELEINLAHDKIPETFEVEVLRSPDGEETTRISFMKHKGGMYAILPYTTDSVIMLDTTRASKDSTAAVLPPETATLVMENGEPLNLKIFVDKSIVEVFVNEKQYVCQRAYPTRKDSVGIALRSRGGETLLESIRFAEIGSIYE